MAHFVKSFDCKNEAHAMWLKKVGGVMARSIGGDRIDILSTKRGGVCTSCTRVG